MLGLSFNKSGGHMCVTLSTLIRPRTVPNRLSWLCIFRTHTTIAANCARVFVMLHSDG